MNSMKSGTWADSLSAPAIGRMIESIAPSKRPEFIASIMEHALPDYERKPTLEAALELLK